MRAKRKVKGSVSSIIELTKPNTKERTVVDVRSVSMQKYHSDIAKMGRDIEKYALSLCVGNLLSVKMALMQAVREVERKIRVNREER